MTLGSHQAAIGRSQVHITPKRIIDALGPFDLEAMRRRATKMTTDYDPTLKHDLAKGSTVRARATDGDLQRWLLECCEGHAQNISAERTLVFECWCLWCGRAGLNPGSKREWAALMQHAGFYRVRARRINGIRLQSWALGMVMAERRNVGGEAAREALHAPRQALTMRDGEK